LLSKRRFIIGERGSKKSGKAPGRRIESLMN
jgi:hypothetical protein